MNTISRYVPFFASVILMWLVLYFIYPSLQYYVDPDGTAYLTIARRYAEGIYVQAINGYWSPWSCWLTALLIKSGLQPIPASVVINAIGATGFLYITQSLLLRFNTDRRLQWWLCSAMVIFLCYAVFAQSFDDLWECFFLLSALRIILARKFTDSPDLWVALGVMGALAYFAKAYSFPFFILNIICCVYILSDTKQQWIKICITSILAMLVISLPWIYALHYKYGIWTTSTAGSLNMSWYLVGHPYWSDNIQHLLPPAYPDSPYYWEDPYASNGATPHFWNSWHLFGLQFIRIGLNLFKLLISTLQLSVFFTITAIVAIGAVRRPKLWRSYPIGIRIITLSFLLFPLGYLLINFESRYLWYMLPLSFVMAGYIIKHNEERLANRFRLNTLYGIFAVTLVIYPLMQMVRMYNSGSERDFELATTLNHAGVIGSFTTNARTSADMQRIARIAYFSGNACYTIPYPDKVSPEELLKEIRRYRIKYYLQILRRHDDENLPLMDEKGKPFKEIRSKRISGYRIFEINDTTSE